MKCNRCGITVSTAADVFNCEECRRDGTADQLGAGTPEKTSIERAIEMCPGLANRFLPEPGDTPRAVLHPAMKAASEAAARPKRKPTAKKRVPAAKK